MTDLPRESWPPPDAHQEGWRFAFEAALPKIKARLIDEQKHLRSAIRETGVTDVVFKIDDATDEGALVLSIGLLRKRKGKKRPRKRKRQPLWMDPKATADIINDLGDLDRVQIARVVFWEYVYDIVDAADDAQESAEEEEEDGNDEDDDDDEYAWNGGAPPLLTAYEDGDGDDEQSCSDGRDHSPATLRIIEERVDLRALYERIVAGTLGARNGEHHSK